MSNKSAFDRFKRYEASYDFKIPPRTYTIVRLDGHGFSKYTKKMNKPFDDTFGDAMDFATKALCEKFSPKFAYTQSDEISLLITDFENIEGEMIFDGTVQKICSLTAGCASAKFNQYLMAKTILKDKLMVLEEEFLNFKTAEFDARVFIIPDFREVSNYFIHRQQDCTRNSISMAAHEACGHNATKYKSSAEKQEMLFQKGINWNDYKPKYKRGTIIAKETYLKETPNGSAMRKRWTPLETPIFTQDRQFLYDLIPVIGITEE